MVLTVFNASCLAKCPWCEVDDDDSEACCDEGDDAVAMIASGSEASEGCVGHSSQSTVACENIREE